MNDLIPFGLYLGLLAPLILVAAMFSPKLKWGWLAAALIYLFVDFCLTVYLPEIPVLHFKSLNWNWVGKLGSILFSISVLAIRPDLRAESGLTFKQRKGSVATSIAAILLLFASGAYLGFQDEKSPLKMETLLFQSSMPSASEELVFRGLFLCLLNRAFGCRVQSAGISWAVPVVVIYFGLGHAVFWADHGLHVAWWSLAVTTAVSGVLMFIRLYSGSLLFSMLGHSAINLAWDGVPMFR